MYDMTRKEQRQMRATNKRDHLAEMFKIMGGQNKFNRRNSSYRAAYAFDNEHKTLLKEKDYSYHFKWDAVKEYSEALCRACLR